MKKLINSPTKNILIFSFFWALYIVQSKIAFIAGAKIISFQIQTGLSALVVLSLVMLPKVFAEARILSREDPKLFWLLALANGLHYGVGGTLYIIGVSQTQAINAGFLVKFSMVTTTFLAWLFLGEKMSWRKFGSLTLFLVGVYLLTTRGMQLVPRSGDLFILSACLAWSFGNVLIRHGLRKDAVSANLVTYLKPLAGLPIFIFLVAIIRLMPDFLSESDLFNLQWLDFGHFRYASVAGVFLAVTWMYLSNSLKVATASYVTMLSTATPIFVSVLAILFLRERFVFIQGVGAAMIAFAGVSIYFSNMAFD